VSTQKTAKVRAEQRGRNLVTILHSSQELLARKLLLILLLGTSVFHSIALASPSPQTPDESLAWKIVRGNADAWKILPDRLECVVTNPGPHWVISSAPIYGDYVIEANIGPAFEKGEGIFFSATPDLNSGYLFTPGVSTHLYKVSGSDLKLVTTWPLGYGTRTGVHNIRILKKGATYSITMEGRVLNTLTSPGWDDTAKPPNEPDGGYWGFAFEAHTKHVVTGMKVLQLPSAELFPNNPVIAQGPKGAWDQLDTFSAAALKDGDKALLYYAADYKPYPPGVYTETLHRIGVATSSDLRHWSKYEGNPILGPPLEGDLMKFFDLPSSDSATLQGGGGAVRLPNGHYALTINVLSNLQWQGVWLTESASPLGPFRKVGRDPILTLGTPGAFDGEHIHLHGVIQKPDGTYAMLYTGFNSAIAEGKPGDRGGLATSEDMVHWTKYPDNPVFAPNTVGTWDDLHVRPKTVVRLKDWYYMFYEGAHYDNRDRWPDQVGMARSKDLIHWERYPYNPIIPATTASHFGNYANIQPAALVSDDQLFVFYGCLEASHPFGICGARIPERVLDGWSKP
jgi:hypothetical protein